MNELMNNFINQIDDVHRIKEMSVEEFTKLVKSNRLISEEDGQRLIESFKKIVSQKNPDDGSDDSDQRKKKYRNQQQAGVSIKRVSENEPTQKNENEKEEEDKSKER